MPDVRMPDGTIVRNVPENTTKAQLMARYEKSRAPQNDKRETSFWEGVKKGALTPFNNATRLLEYGLDKVGVADDIQNLGARIGMAPSVDAAEKTQRTKQAKAKYKPSPSGEFVGNVVGTLPTAFLPGGPFMQGAYSSGLLTNKRDPAQIGAEMLVGGVLGKVGDKAIRGGAKVIAPRASKALRTLTNKGVRVTPGQAARGSDGFIGRTVTAFEDRGSSLPGPTGDLIRKNQRRAAEDYVSGAINDMLSGIGKSIPEDTPVGHEAIAYAQKAASKAYDDALANMSVRSDRILRNDVGGLVRDVKNGGLGEPQLNQFRKTVNNVVLRRAKAGNVLSGDTFKKVMSELNGKARQYSASSTASEQELGGAYSALADYLESAARRQSSKASADALDAANAAYAKLVRIEGAAKNAKGGVFSPSQLETSVGQADSSVRKRAVAAGRALLQDYATAGREIIPQAIGDSGTAGREAVWNPIAWGVDFGAYLPYLAAQKTIPPFMARTPGPTATGLADLLMMSAPIASNLAPITAQSLANGGQ